MSGGDKTKDDLLIELASDGTSFVVRHIPDHLVQFLGRHEDQITGLPARSGMGELGMIIDHVGLEVLKEKMPVQRHKAEFTDRDGIEYSVLIVARKVSDPVEGSPNNPEVTGRCVAMDIEILEKTLETDVRHYQAGIFHGIIGQSEPMLLLFDRIRTYAPTDAPVVITGETGTGKELVARALHDLSRRRSKPFVAVNCTALNEELFESELFGHERGSFTGALRDHRGRFERAEKGTLFLDEIGDMPPRSQAKMLRVLETGVFERVGGERELRTDVRIIAATNISLELAVSRGQFRDDLYHRLTVLRIHVPSLRNRLDDIPLLSGFFLKLLNERYGKNIERLTPDAIRRLQNYHWPGNVRELRNVIERVYVETRSAVIGSNAFREWENERDYLAAGSWNLQHYEQQRLTRVPIVPPVSPSTMTNPDHVGQASIMPVAYHRALPAGYQILTQANEIPFSSRDETQQKPVIDKDVIIRLYHESDGNLTLVARKLGIHKATLYRRMKRMGINRQMLARTLTGSSGNESAPE